MGKQGPCCHCGVTSTPLWRNGPPEKPVLCNACGSRWRTKGTLVNYTPLHARSEPDDFEDQRFSGLKTLSIKNKEVKFLKRKKNYEMIKGFDEDTSNRSSSGSAISNSDSCMQLGNADACDLTGPAQSSVVWDTTVPSKKRTCVSRPKQSPVEKLTKDLYNILHEQQSYFSGSSEEDLIFESHTPMVSVEIGHGSVLIRHPSSMAREEESESSSLSFETKNEAYSRFSDKVGNFSSRGSEKTKAPLGNDQMDRENDEKSPVLTNHKSPLCQIDLENVINFDEFTSQMTSDEQKHLLKYLPLVDTVNLPNSLKSMFDSPQFKDNLSSFQKLLADGVFDLGVSDVKKERFRKIKNLALHNVTKSKWVEQYNLLQVSKGKKDHGGCLVAGISTNMAPERSMNAKRSRDAQFHSFQGSKNTMKSPNRSLMKASYEHKDNVETDATGFSPRSLFALPPDNSALLLDSLRYTDEFSDQDLLLDVPSHTSFPQAELLLPSTTSGTSMYRH